MVATALACFVIGGPAMRAQDTATNGTNGIDGKWHFVLDTPGGERDVDADFTVDNDGNVTGKWGDANAAGTWKEGKLDLTFDFTSDEVGVTAPMKISGKLDETAALAGDWAFSEYNGTFKATRPAAEPAAAQPAAAQGSSDPQQPHF